CATADDSCSRETEAHDGGVDDTDLRHVAVGEGKPREHKGYDYARSINPTRLAYEECIADLESGSRGFAFASGLSAMATVLEALDSGSRMLSRVDLLCWTFTVFIPVPRGSRTLVFFICI